MTSPQSYSPASSAASSTKSGVLFVASGGLGDAVMLAHVFPRFAALAQPGERVVLVLRRDAGKMAFLFQGQAEVQTVDYDRFAKSFWFRRTVIKNLAATPWRMSVDLDFLRHPKRDEALVMKVPAETKLAMAPRSWPKYDRALNRNTRRYTRLFKSGPVHLDKVLRWARFADWLNGTVTSAPIVQLPADRLPISVAAAKPYVVLIPFSAVREKQATPRLFLDIVDRLPREWDIVVAGAPDDPQRNPDYAELLNRPSVSYDAANFERLAPRLRGSQLVISVDTAAMHLAVAVGAPTLCLASAAYVNEIVPYAAEITPPNVRFVYTQIPCAGCLGACVLPLEQDRFACVARISAAQSIVALTHLLSLGAAA